MERTLLHLERTVQSTLCLAAPLIRQVRVHLAGPLDRKSLGPCCLRLPSFKAILPAQLRAKPSYKCKHSSKSQPLPITSHGDSASVCLVFAGDAQGNAFTRLMQQQRNQSKIHNFYLLMRPDRTYTWHWWITDPSSDAKMAATLLPKPQQGQRRDAEFSKGAVNPVVRSNTHSSA